MNDWTALQLCHSAPCYVCGEVQYWSQAQDERAEGPWSPTKGRAEFASPSIAARREAKRQLQAGEFWGNVVRGYQARLDIDGGHRVGLLEALDVVHQLQREIAGGSYVLRPVDLFPGEED